jgi:hypothetical protein
MDEDVSTWQGEIGAFFFMGAERGSFVSAP